MSRESACSKAGPECSRAGITAHSVVLVRHQEVVPRVRAVPFRLPPGQRWLRNLQCRDARVDRVSLEDGDRSQIRLFG